MCEYFIEDGGLRWGETPSLEIQAPFSRVTMTITGDGLLLNAEMLSLWNPEYYIARSEVVDIGWMIGCGSFGALIQHKNPNCPQYVLFWTYSPRLRQELERFGYVVHRTDN